MAPLLLVLAAGAALFAATPAFGQQWSEVVRSESGDIYSLDAQSVRTQSPGVRYAWIQVNLRVPVRRDNGLEVVRYERRLLFDCSAQRFARWSEIAYDARGHNQVQTTETKFDYQPVRDGSVAQALWQRVCGSTSAATPTRENPAAANWVEVARNDDDDVFYIDRNYRATDAGKALGWIRKDILKPDVEADGRRVTRKEILFSIDCQRARYATKAAFETDDRGARRPVTLGAAQSTFDPIEPGTVGVAIASAVCEQAQLAFAAPEAPAPAPKKAAPVKFATIEGNDWYYFPSTLKFSDPAFEVVTFRELAKPVADQRTGRMVHSQGMHVEANCAQSRLRITKAFSFDKDVEQVAEIELNDDDQRSRQYAERTVGFRLLSEICAPKGYTIVAAAKSPEPAPSSPGKSGTATSGSSGSGFAVSPSGHIVTNHHVVDGCQRVHVTTQGQPRTSVQILATDNRNDLALLKAPFRTPVFAQFRATPIRAGDGVVALGYPLRGLLAAEANVSTGTVSALAGLLNDTSKLQVSAPIQPGNSGGPLLDMSGAVAGVAVEKLDAIRIAKATGDIPSLVAFSIKGELVTAFLRSSGVEPVVAPSNQPRLEAADVAARGKPFTYLVECESTQ